MGHISLKNTDTKTIILQNENTLLILYMYQIFFFLQGHLHFFLHFFLHFCGTLFYETDIINHLLNMQQELSSLPEEPAFPYGPLTIQNVGFLQQDNVVFPRLSVALQRGNVALLINRDIEPANRLNHLS